MNIINNENESTDDSLDDSDGENQNVKISYTDGLRAIESTIEYIEQKEEATPVFLLSFKK